MDFLWPVDVNDPSTRWLTEEKVEEETQHAEDNPLEPINDPATKGISSQEEKTSTL